MILLILLILFGLLYLIYGILHAYLFFRIQDNDTLLWVVFNWPLDVKFRVTNRFIDYYESKFYYKKEE